jgi:hypothetical protein
MKKISETYKELGIAFTFPIQIVDANGNQTYYELSGGYWSRSERDAIGNRTYFENSDGEKLGTPRSAKTCEGKVVEVDGIKYKLTAL